MNRTISLAFSLQGCMPPTIALPSREMLKMDIRLSNRILLGFIGKVKQSQSNWFDSDKIKTRNNIIHLIPFHLYLYLYLPLHHSPSLDCSKNPLPCFSSLLTTDFWLPPTQLKHTFAENKHHYILLWDLRERLRSQKHILKVNFMSDFNKGSERILLSHFNNVR